MYTKRVAVIVFYDEKKRILLQYRAGLSRYGTEWGFFGGKIESGETPEQALVREIKEELDYDLKEYKFLCELARATNNIWFRHSFSLHN